MLDPTLRVLVSMVGLLVPALMAVPQPVRAQAPLTVEARGGVFMPVSGFRTGPESGGDLAPGTSIGVHLALERSGGLHFLLGFSQHRMDCSDDGCSGDGEYVSTAWDLGARLDLGSGRAVPWIRVGVTVPRVERDRPEPLDADVSDLGIGAEGGVGLRVSVAGRFHLSPGVRFGAADLGLAPGGTLRMRYVVADIGLVVGF